MRNWSCNTYQLFVNSTRPARWISQLFACLSLHSSSINSCYRHCSPKRYLSIFMFIRMHPGSPSVTLWICILASWLDVEWHQNRTIAWLLLQTWQILPSLTTDWIIQTEDAYFMTETAAVFTYIWIVLKFLKTVAWTSKKLKGFSLQKTTT